MDARPNIMKHQNKSLGTLYPTILPVGRAYALPGTMSPKNRFNAMNDNNDVIILHISDLHRTPEAKLTNDDLWESLRHDIWNTYRETNDTLEPPDPCLPSPEQIDLVIVSGDLTQQADKNEYKEVEAFLNALVDNLLHGNRKRLVLVPGNHDIDWNYSRGAYTEVKNLDSGKIKQAFHPDSTLRIQLSDLSLWQRTTEHQIYNERLKSFSQFFSRFYKRAYKFPIDDPKKQFIIFDEFVKELGIVVIGFSSCDYLDHLWHRGSIRREAILLASGQLDTKGYKRDGPLRIAVWHHNVFGSPQQSDFMDPRTAVLLAEHGVALGLHGHVHQSGRIEILGAHARIPIVWAGSLCAGSKERPPSIPYLYNVIGINRTSRSGWVHVRSRDNEGAGWTSYDKFEGRKPYYYLPSPEHNVSGRTAGTYSKKGKQRLSNVHEAAETLQDIIETAMRRSGKIDILNLALDMAVMWPKLRDCIFQYANITWDSLILDPRAETTDAFKRELAVNIDTSKIDAVVRDIQRYCRDKKRDMQQKNIRFRCRAYRTVPVLHGFLVNRENLLVSLCGIENNYLTGARNRYLQFHVKEDKELAENYIRIFESWFSACWKTGLKVWPMK